MFRLNSPVLLSGKSAVIGIGLAAAVVGCTRQTIKTSTPPVAKSSEKQKNEQPAVIVTSGLLPKLENNQQFATLPGGLLLPVTYVQGTPYITVESALADASYQKLVIEGSTQKLDQKSLVERALRDSVEIISSASNVMLVKTVPEVGYMKFMLPYDSFNSLQSLKGLQYSLLINPVVLDNSSHVSVKNLSKTLNQDLQDAGVVTFSDSFSGLKRIGEIEFQKILATDVPGISVDGSSVKVGVTDTGITYNHPTFLDASGKNRISYMKDFTNEGTIFFAPDAKFEARTPTKTDALAAGENKAEVLFISAQVLRPGATTSLPFADDFTDIADRKILVSKELRTQLLTEGNSAKLAVLSEAAFANPTEKEFVDLNGNKKSDDSILAIYLPASSSSETGSVYLALGGNDDFRNSVPLKDFNKTQSVVSAFQEKFGLQIEPKILAKKDDPKAKVQVIGAAVVGYDPGNHGSHVSGIIAGRKTISNDSNSTLARGVAPASELMVNRVCANMGGCPATEAIIDLSLAGAEIINMSLGGLSPFNDGYGIQETIINRLTLQQNTLFVISAGNSGPGIQTIGSPSVARLSLSVGASASRSLIENQYNWPGTTKAFDKTLDNQDFMLFFSSRGPTAAGGFKPNLVAPGTELSSIQLNSAEGSRSGLDVYWGTSMSAPTAAGAAALLLDAAKKYNQQNPTNALPTDAISLRSALIEGAIGFDVAKVNTTTGVASKGQYTWIDQGSGLINLPSSWEKLKALAKSKAPASVTRSVVDKSGSVKSEPVVLDYEVRVLRKQPNGLDYTGAVPVAQPIDLQRSQLALAPKFGRGVWIDPASQETLYAVQIARKLPLHLLQSADAGELMRQLNTSAESFELETEIYGSQSKWLTAGTLHALDCSKSKLVSALNIIGQGPTDAFNEDGTGTSVGLRASTLYLCTNTAAIRALPPGDHGAIIKAYRKTTIGREAVAAFEVPVYLTKPHKVLESNQKYEISGVARSFDVKRNYVVVPEGTTVVSVSLEVPELKADGSGCAGVELMAYEALNTERPKEITPRDNAIASNCTLTGAPGGSRIIGYQRSNPRPGIWDLHVFGSYQFLNSPYKLTVEYAKVASSVLKIVGKPAILNGEFSFNINESSFAVEPSAVNSQFTLDSLLQSNRRIVKQKESLAVSNSDGEIFRTYNPSSVGSVTFNTFGAPASDIDLDVFECTAANDSECKRVVSSGTSTDVETATFVPVAGKFYKAIVVGYEIEGGKETEFTFEESLSLTTANKGNLTIAQDAASPTRYNVKHSFDIAGSSILQDVRFASGKYNAKGFLAVRTKSDSEIVNVPVTVVSKDDISFVGRSGR